MLLFLLSITEDEENKEKVEYLFHKHKVEIVRFAKTRLKRYNVHSYNTDADDILQETFLRIITYIDDIDLSRSENDIKSYVMRMALNVINDFIENLNKRVPDDVMNDEEDSESVFYEQMNLIERYENTMKAIDRLDEKYQVVITYRFKDKKNVDEIAEILGITRKGVEARIQRGRKMLHELIEEEYNG